MRVLRASVAAALVFVTACGAPPPGYGTTPAPTRSVPARGSDDADVVGNGTVVRAVAVGRRWVVAATPSMIVSYDRDLRRWLPAIGRDNGLDPAAVRAIAHDPDDDSFWLLTPTGAWTLQPALGFLAPAPSGPLPARLHRGTLEALYREWPSLEAFQSLLTRDDAALRGYDVISGARAPDRAEAWLGTNGGGLFQADPLFNRAESRAFGLAAVGAGAMARMADGVMATPSPITGASGPSLSVVARDLQRARWLRSVRGGVAAGQGTAVATRGTTVWLGTLGGLFVTSLASSTTPEFVSIANLPSPIVLALAAVEGGVYVGTSRGLAFVPDSIRAAVSVDAMGSGPVRAMIADGASLWLGTDAGLLVQTPQGARRPIGAPRALETRVHALARDGATIFVATDAEIHAYDTRTGTWTQPWPAAAWSSLGGLRAIDADARSLWAVGPLGVMSVNRRDGVTRLRRAGAGLAGEPSHLLLDGAWGWVGTADGLVRFRRAPDGSLP